MRDWKKNDPEEVLPAFSSPADEVVSEILGEAGQRQAEMRLSAEERQMLIEARRKAQEKKEKARQKAQRQNPRRLHVLLPEDLKQQLQQLAEGYKVPTSQVVAFLLYEALGLYPDGEPDFTPYLYPSKSPRYESNLIHPQDPKARQKSDWKWNRWALQD